MIKFIIIGRQGSGKSHFLDLFKQHDFKTLKTHTTRPKRFPEEDTYYFHDGYELASKDILAADNVNNHLYFTTKTDVLEADVLVLSPQGVIEVAEAFPQIGFRVLFLTPDDALREGRLKLRVKDDLISEEMLENRTQWDEHNFKIWDEIVENEKIGSELNLPSNILAVSNIVNDYQDETLIRFVHESMETKKLIENLEQIVEKALNFDVLSKGPNNTVKVVMEGNGQPSHQTISEFAHTILSDPISLTYFLMNCISEGVFTKDEPKDKDLDTDFKSRQISMFDD